MKLKPLFRKIGFIAIFVAVAFAINVFGTSQAASTGIGKETVADYDGNVYKTVKIGKQVWMAENLRTSHYRDGSPVKYADYGNNPANSLVYGKLYTWTAAMLLPA